EHVCRRRRGAVRGGGACVGCAGGRVIGGHGVGRRSLDGQRIIGRGRARRFGTCSGALQRLRVHCGTLAGHRRGGIGLHAASGKEQGGGEHARSLHRSVHGLKLRRSLAGDKVVKRGTGNGEQGTVEATAAAPHCSLFPVPCSLFPVPCSLSPPLPLLARLGS